jgi:hypothetical protein
VVLITQWGKAVVLAGQILWQSLPCRKLAGLMQALTCYPGRLQVLTCKK